MEIPFPAGKRPPCHRCGLIKTNSLYWWAKIKGVIRYFCLGCERHVPEAK